MYINPQYMSLQSVFSPGLLEFPDEFLAEYFKEGKQAAGFVVIEDDGERVTACHWDEEAYQAWVAAHPAPDPLPNAVAQKEAEISAACNAAIVAGMDVETSAGTEHFSLQETDQINLTTAYNAINTGATAYPYHADGKVCRIFTADEIKAISAASISHKLYHTTLCNHLLTWCRRAETVEEVNGITYSADNLPEDLAANMAQVLAAASALAV